MQIERCDFYISLLLCSCTQTLILKAVNMTAERVHFANFSNNQLICRVFTVIFLQPYIWHMSESAWL